MKADFFYCEYWDFKSITHMNRDFNYCVSPIIYGNEENTLLQVHCLIKKNNKVLICSKENMLENWLKNSISSMNIWNKNNLDRNVVKIWYYDIDEYNIDLEKELLMRFSITLNGIVPLQKNEEDELLKKIEDQIKKFIISI